MEYKKYFCIVFVIVGIVFGFTGKKIEDFALDCVIFILIYTFFVFMFNVLFITEQSSYLWIAIYLSASFLFAAFIFSYCSNAASDKRSGRPSFSTVKDAQYIALGIWVGYVIGQMVYQLIKKRTARAI